MKAEHDERRRVGEEPTNRAASDSTKVVTGATGGPTEAGPDRAADGASADVRSEEVAGAVWDAFHELRFDMDRSRRYHALFERHYGAWHRRIRLLSLAFASAAAASLLGAPLGGWAALVVTVLQLMDNQYRLSEQAASHRGLRKQYTALYASLMRYQDELLRGELAPVREWQAKYETIYAQSDEHGIMEVANARAHNAAARAIDGDEGEMFAITPVQYALACYIDWRPGRLKKAQFVAVPKPLGARLLDWIMAD